MFNIILKLSRFFSKKSWISLRQCPTSRSFQMITLFSLNFRFWNSLNISCSAVNKLRKHYYKTNCGNCLVQHLPSDGESWPGRPSLPNCTSAGERIGICSHLRLLWPHLLCNQWPQLHRCTIRHHGCQTHGPPRLHRLCLLGTNSILRPHRSSRISPDRCSPHQNPACFLLSPQLLCQPLSLCFTHETVSERSLHPPQPAWLLHQKSCKVQRSRWWILNRKLCTWKGNFHRGFCLLPDSMHARRSESCSTAKI